MVKALLRERIHQNHKKLALLQCLFHVYLRVSNHMTKEDWEKAHGKGKYGSTNNTKIGKERGNSYRKNEGISG